MPDEIKAFWDEQAKIHKDALEATTPDRFLRELEINAINAELYDTGTLLDIGCGNGYSTVRFKMAHPKLEVTGMDFSGEMLGYAPKDRGVTWCQGDVRHTGLEESSFGQITTDRCLINLRTEADQEAAIEEIHRLLVPDGRYLMCENWVRGLDDLNTYRAAVGLKAITVRWHNRYLHDSLWDCISSLFSLDASIPFASTYYLCSRIINARLAEDMHQEPQYDARVNEIAKHLPALGDLGPMKLMVLRKR